ncbi:hypothetical protein E0Z10_g10434 [Xylaria hypoxylon]|uniref:Retroviral polymerase SH3-like domain-containing protein n=1 Tax=Xylaria hypoxylon TaxID=37992 RepID=A0A4Z0YEN2_9PEZI|nr:hypothetical protein E0Z10_g10434 [Xylaria hypoxylon]
MTPTARKDYMVGYRDHKAKIYMTWVPELHKIVDVRDMRFDESTFHDSDEQDSVEYEAVFNDPGDDELGDLIESREVPIRRTLRSNTETDQQTKSEPENDEFGDAVGDLASEDPFGSAVESGSQEDTNDPMNPGNEVDPEDHKQVQKAIA